ncbi:MAG: amidohydrolase family protein [Clostridia bacterium]|nr:amidohydrolase family protein [Clostridia bacterium]
MFFDIHAHMYKYPYPTEDGRFLMSTPAQVSKRYQELDITGAAILPILGPELYVPQSVGEVIDIANESDGKYVAFCNVDPRALTNSSDAPLGILLEHYKKLGCRGIGEVMPNLPWEDSMMQNLLKCVEKSGLPLIFDITAKLGYEYGIYDDAGLPQLERCLDKYPDLVFIGHGPAFWAEISALNDPADRLGYPRYKITKEGRVAELMRKYPNLWVDLSAGSGANAMLRDMEYAGLFMREFHDRILFGTDICFHDQSILQPQILRDLLGNGSLTVEMFEKIARKNAYRLLKIDRE